MTLAELEVLLEKHLRTSPEKRRAFLAEVALAGGPSAWEEQRMRRRCREAHERFVARYGERATRDLFRRIYARWDSFPPMPAGAHQEGRTND